MDTQTNSRAGCSCYAKYAISAMLFFCTMGSVQADHIFRLGTGGSAGSYFPIGSLIATAINKQRIKTADGEELVVVPQRSSGSVSNLIDISSNLLEGGLAQADVVSLAYQGSGQFSEAGTKDKLSTIGTLYLESMHFVVSTTSDIRGIEDLVGKRVSVDELGSGTQLDIDPVLAAYGLTRNDMKPVYLKPEDSIARMRRGQLDAFFVIAGYPVTGVKSLVDDGVGRVVSLAGERIEKIIDEYAFFTENTIPEDVYSNDAVIHTLSVPAQMIVRTDISENTVYEITKNLWSEDTLQILAAGHPRGMDIQSTTALQGVGIPLHPGAKRFYHEMGYDMKKGRR